MIQWALIATATAALSAFALVKTLQAKRKQASEYEARLDDMRQARDAARREAEKRLHVIEAQQEAIQHAAKEKRDIREHSDPGDRARAATDVMRELSRDDRRDGDSSTSSD